jgi:site-specific DNA-methyltransferase (cytosine-N4-specific)
MSSVDDILPSGYVVFVIGSRTMRRIRIPTDQILVEMGEKYGLQHERIIYRRIPSKRLPWKNAPENIPGMKGEKNGKSNSNQVCK